MDALISLFAIIAGMPSLTCAQAQALAATYACLPRQDQLPVLIALAVQMTESLIPGPQGPAGPTGPQGPAGPSGGGVGEIVWFTSSGAGTPPPFTPSSSTFLPGVTTAAIATDISTGQQWNYVNGAWQ